jgi:hypothetical protein
MPMTQQSNAPKQNVPASKHGNARAGTAESISRKRRGCLTTGASNFATRQREL